ncbi:unnamed protein product [Lactuca saligna]|uniref:Uncharacterized protein n=1 Tax=Lactuca saligna TaxID=75948 RepID=A0AA35YCW2_LACSI|nr:unnamed protein product [Lactuca saligna]
MVSPTTIEALELLSSSHPSNSLLYATAQDDLRSKLLALEVEKCSSEENYNLLVGEMASLEDKVIALDGSVEHLSQRIERKSTEDDLGWLLQKGIARVVDKVVECFEFVIGVNQMKRTCMVAGVENGKQEVREQVIAGKFVPGEAAATTKHIQAMHVVVKAFMEIDFASYLHLCELDMAGLWQLCDDSDAEDSLVEGGSSHAGASPGN